MKNSNAANSENQEPKPAPSFATEKDLLQFILAGATAIALNVREQDFRAIYPTAVSGSETIDALVDQHLSGKFEPRLCIRKDGSEFKVENHYALGAYIVRRGDDGACTTTALVFDIDGPDHDAQRTQADVDTAARTLRQVLEDEGLSPFMARSHGGRGYHIWVLFYSPVPAGAAKTLGEAAVIISEIKFEIEIFPKQGSLAPGSLGNPIALPFNGRKVSETGGNLIWPDGSPRPVDTIRVVDVSTIADHLNTCHEIERASVRISAARAAQKNFYRLLNAGRRDPKDFSDLGMERICRELGEITDEYVSEINVLKLRCPRHSSVSGTSLHVCPEDGWWKCHACGDKGAGETAEFSLARWLMTDKSESEVLDRLEQLRSSTEGEVANG